MSIKLTKDDLEMFNSLAGSNLGERLSSYLERLQSSVCDSRNWAPHETKEHANKTSSVIQEEIINRIRVTKDNPTTPPYPYM
jgi:hypothetical protein